VGLVSGTFRPLSEAGYLLPSSGKICATASFAFHLMQLLSFFIIKKKIHVPSWLSMLRLNRRG